MNTFLVIVIAVLIYAFFVYKKAKRKQQELRAKAREYFEDIKLTIEYWLKDKDDADRKKLAKISQTIYDEKRKTVTFMPISKYSAEQFEYLDEWRLIFNEVDLLNSNWMIDPIKGEKILEFQSALAELREIELDQIK